MENPDVLPTASAIDRLIGNTPLVGLQHLVPPGTARILVKLEYQNPGGSVKDRPALAIIRAAEREGRLRSGVTLLDASSGNTAIAYAMLCAAHGHRCELCVPESAGPDRLGLLRSYGATVVITDSLEGSDGAIGEAQARAARWPEHYFYADQYNNRENVVAHYQTTAAEIWRQTRGKVTHLVASLGTSGTFVGTGRRLKELNPAIRLIAAQPDSPLHGIEGVKHMATAIVPGIYDPALADATHIVTTEAAQVTAARLVQDEGLWSGPSGGANVVAALEVARVAGPDAVVVTFLPDGGEAHLAERLRGTAA
jgi:cysteine synthase B